MENAERIEEILMAQKVSEGKDEMNLAEFPLCALSHRPQHDQKTLRFEDRLFDKGKGEWITRQLTVTGSDAFGLPTALDDEVLLGLIQLTHQRNFADRKVPFTRHQLLRLLDWRNDSKNYRRLETSLNRWTGVTLYYDNAWWNKARQCWVDEKFHVLENVWLCHHGKPPPDTGLDESDRLVSAFVWNEVIFRSFQAGNLKSIDFEFFKSLDSAVAKRLYRFLDKRFWHRDRWEFQLQELACQHLGFSSGYDISNLKRKMLPGIRELESRGYLATVPETDRFRKVRAGVWLVRFEEGKAIFPPKGFKPLILAPEKKLTESLVARGVSAGVAEEVCASEPADKVRAKLKIFDWLVQRRDPKISRNPAGFLVRSIRDGYAPPGGFPTKEAPEERGMPLTGRKPSSAKQNSGTNLREAAEAQANRLAIEKFWQSIPEPERRQLEAEVIATAAKVARDAIERGGPFAAPARQTLLDTYALKILAG